MHNGLTEIVCILDRGATFKTDIGNTDAFIERCASGYNQYIRDNAASGVENTFITAAQSGNITPYGPSSGIICVSAVSTDVSVMGGSGVGTFFFDPGVGVGVTYSIKALLQKLWTQSVYDNLKLVLKDAYSAIIKCVFVPGFELSNMVGGSNPFAAGSITLGDTQYGDVPCVVPARETYGIRHSGTWTYDVDNLKHFNSFGWRNFEPFCSWKLFLPYFGVVDIPADELLGDAASSNIVVKWEIDYTTGDLVYRRFRRKYVSGVATDYLMGTYKTCIGVNIALSQITGSPFEFASSMAGAAANATLGNAAAAVSNAVSGIISSYKTGLSTAGGFGANGIGVLYNEPLKITLMQCGHESNVTPDTYAASIGLPLMAQDTISNHSGYIKCNNASVSMNGTQADKDAVNAMLNNGFFFE